MCGITAILRRELDAERPDSEASTRRIEAMTRAIEHRGPDAQGIYKGPHAALGHRRLSILDLETGDQPMYSIDGELVVVFNGEIYNHHELREQLEAKGHRFRTRSDTEVLLVGYREWGSGLPEHLLGFFAFAIHDQRSGATLLARDPIGKKPLFYVEHEGQLLFSSEVRSFLELPGFHRELDPRALSEFLALRYVPGAGTLLEGVQQVPPAHRALHRPGEALRCEPYFEVDWTIDPGAADSAGYEKAVGELQQLFQRCVEDRLESDVPLGAFLSGGVDSSGVVKAMLDSGYDVHAVTVGFDESQHDESVYAQEFAARHGAKLSVERCKAEPAAQLPQLAEIMDLPMTDSSLLPTWLVCRAARRHVTVAISGDGGDELFAGYRRYRFDLVENRARRLIGRTLPGLAARVVPKGDWLPQKLRFKRTFENLAQDPAEAYFRSVSALLPSEVHAMLAGDVVPDGFDPFTKLRDVYQRSKAPDHASRLLDLDQKTYLPGDILTKVDRASMAVSLEVRSPLLDRRMLSWAARMPIGYKLDRKEGKKLLKSALEDGLGREWLDRPKQGFTIPLAEWLRGPLKDARNAAIEGAFAKRFLDGDVVSRWAREHDQGRRDRAEALWAVLVLHQWNERWGKQA